MLYNLLYGTIWMKGAQGPLTPVDESLLLFLYKSKSQACREGYNSNTHANTIKLTTHNPESISLIVMCRIWPRSPTSLENVCTPTQIHDWVSACLYNVQFISD